MNFASIILSAGKGTRMKSSLPKVMHKIAGLPLISHVINTISPLNPQELVIVTSENAEDIFSTGQNIFANAKHIVQADQLGTGHAVLSAKDELKNYAGRIIILYADTPLICTRTLKNMLKKLADFDIIVLGMRTKNPTGYGRLILNEIGDLQKIVECKEANNAEKNINLCNSGVIAASSSKIFELLTEVNNDNSKGEYYLTDIIEIAHRHNLKCGVVETSEDELIGVNSQTELAKAEYIFQQNKRQKLLENGVSMIDPSSVFFSYDTKIASDTLLESNIFFGQNVQVEQGAYIKAFSHIEGAKIGKNVTIGPFARIRPNTILEENSAIGNFVEIKNSHLMQGVKAGHLSYLGDAEIGEATNIGAGTITCNYDGKNKHKTIIGKNNFIGSNSAIIAPIKIGDGVLLAAGSVITKNISDNELAVARVRQKNIPRKD